jgi:hypothetical protein
MVANSPTTCGCIGGCAFSRAQNGQFPSDVRANRVIVHFATLSAANSPTACAAPVAGILLTSAIGQTTTIRRTAAGQWNTTSAQHLGLPLSLRCMAGQSHTQAGQASGFQVGFGARWPSLWFFYCVQRQPPGPDAPIDRSRSSAAPIDRSGSRAAPVDRSGRNAALTELRARHHSQLRRCQCIDRVIFGPDRGDNSPTTCG